MCSPRPCKFLLLHGLQFFKSPVEYLGGGPQYAGIPHRVPHILFHTEQIVIIAISVFVKHRSVNQGGISPPADLPVVIQPLVQHEHFGIDFSKFVLGNDTVTPFAG